MNVEGYGIRAQLPAGWEGALRAAPPEVDPPAPLVDEDVTTEDEDDTDTDGTDEGTTMRRSEVAPQDAEVPAVPVLHAATFPLPVDRGDFGSGAVELMREGDSFVALLEYGREEVDTPLFASQGLPRRLDPRVFSNRSLQRQLPNQAGWQHFFTENGRAFCLYVVLGDRHDANLLVRRVEQVLADLVIEPAP